MEQQIFKKNTLDKLKKQVKNYNRILVVRVSNVYKSIGADNFIESIVDDKQFFLFSDFTPNPKLKDLQKALKFCKEIKPDFIIAIGGGSVMDMAKLISVTYFIDTDIAELIKTNKGFSNNKIPVLSVPTTSGSGAEATSFAVVYIDKIKYSLAHQTLLPDMVFLTYEFAQFAPPYLTACSGLDAFSQAIESMWSVGANCESVKYSEIAIKKVWANLYSAVHESNKNAIKEMSEAAYLAGKAINITKTTAPHAISYAFTSYYNIPHGHAVALSLPYFFEYNYYVTNKDCTDNNGAKNVIERINKILNILEINIEDIQLELEKFFNSIGISININELTNSFNRKLIINNINTERLKNNPRLVNKETIDNFLNSIE